MRIGRREMGLLALGGFFFLALMYYLVIVSPAVARQKKLAGLITKKENDLN